MQEQTTLESRKRFPWIALATLVVASYLVAFVWFWFGVMAHGWWYPPVPPVVQQFAFVDGESTYDAQVVNLFVVLLTVSVLMLLAHHLTNRIWTPPATEQLKTHRSKR